MRDPEWVAGLIVLAACSFSPRATPGDDDAPPVDAPADAVAFTCPGGYGQIAGAVGSVYKKYGADGDQTPSPAPGRATWMGAEAACRADGPGIHLAIPDDDAEHRALADLVSGASRWLGVTDRVQEGSWIAIVAGEPHVENWLGGSPDTSSTAYDCYLLTRVVVADTNAAEATPCDDPDAQWHKGYICECDGRVTDPATF